MHRLALVTLALVLPGCPGDPSADVGVDAPADVPEGVDAELLDVPMPLDVPAPLDTSVDIDGGALDGGADAGSPESAPYAVRLAYFPSTDDPAPPAAHLCGREAGDATWTELVGGVGIERGQVSRWAPVRRGAWTLRLFAAGGSCDAPFFTTTADIGLDSASNHTTLTYSSGRTPGIVSSVTFYRWRPMDLTGIDRLVVHHLARDPATPGHALDFVTGAERTRITWSRFDIPAGTLGSVEVNFDAEPPMDEPHPYLAGDAVSTSLFVTGDATGVAISFCDDFAPSDGVLAHCSTTLRAP